jgi:hypothetical protein
MSAREIAEAVEKNHHPTRSLLRKMEEAGHRQWRPSDGIDQKEQLSQQQPRSSDAIDYGDDSDYA